MISVGMRNNILISLSTKILSIAGWTSQAVPAVQREKKTIQIMAKISFILYGLMYCKSLLYNFKVISRQARRYALW